MKKSHLSKITLLISCIVTACLFTTVKFSFASANYTLLDSTVFGVEWDDSFEVYNCYSFAIGRTDNKYSPGYFSNANTTGREYADELAVFVKDDLETLGYNDVYITDIRPDYNTLGIDEILICIRRGMGPQAATDFHFMKYDSGDWYHKPGISAILKYNYEHPDEEEWTSEGSYKGVESEGKFTYTDDIWYIVYNKFAVAELSPTTVEITHVVNTFQSTVEIPSEIDGKTVTSIAAGAFEGHRYTETIIVPETVTYIDDNAFFGCSALLDIDVDQHNNHYASVDGFLYNKTLQELKFIPEGYMFAQTEENSYKFYRGAYSESVTNLVCHSYYFENNPVAYSFYLNTTAGVGNYLLELEPDAFSRWNEPTVWIFDLNNPSPPPIVVENRQCSMVQLQAEGSYFIIVSISLDFYNYQPIYLNVFEPTNYYYIQDTWYAEIFVAIPVGEEYIDIYLEFEHSGYDLALILFGGGYLYADGLWAVGGGYRLSTADGEVYKLRFYGSANETVRLSMIDYAVYSIYWLQNYYWYQNSYEFYAWEETPRLYAFLWESWDEGEYEFEFWSNNEEPDFVCYIWIVDTTDWTVQTVTAFTVELEAERSYLIVVSAQAVGYEWQAIWLNIILN